MRVIAVLLAAICVSSAATAAEEPGNFEITPLGGYRFGGSFDVQGSDDSYELEDSSSFGLILNLRDQANTQWEILYSQQNANAELNSATAQSRVGLDIQVLQIGGTYQGPGDNWRPYLAATIGGTRFDTSSGDDTFFSGSIGIGVQIMPESRLGIRFEARAYGTLTDSDTDLFCRTGPDLNICAVRVDGEIFSQIETFAGIVFRF